MTATPGEPPIVLVHGPLPCGEPVRITRPAGRLTLTWDPRQISRDTLRAAAERAVRERP
ncbi:hypothetical protein KYY02_31255 [Streptomyces pimonensis]|uniref:Uncharacterized protein n=1 Tax=Streptomyces pimonensis TaxID=2860288 RepID=A0ABV4J7R9_9ACTN